MRISRRSNKLKMKGTGIPLYLVFTILFIRIINESFASPSPAPDSSFVFPGPSTADDFNPSVQSFANDYDPPEYTYGDKFERRHLNGFKTRHLRPYSSMGHSCRGHRCEFEGYGSRPNNKGYYPQNQPSGDNLGATSTKTVGQPDHLVSNDGSGPIFSQANAQSATFNFGPFSASFSTANSISVPNRPTNFNY